MTFAGENITCSYSCTSYVGTGRYIVISILISIMSRRSHVTSWLISAKGMMNIGHDHGPQRDWSFAWRSVHIIGERYEKHFTAVEWCNVQEKVYFLHICFAFSSMTLPFLVYIVLLHGHVGHILHFFRYLPRQNGFKRKSLVTKRSIGLFV